jgi:sugar phosphate isomerase/epimerase
MLASTETRIGNEHAGLFCELGYDYIELPLAQVMDLSKCDFNEMLRKIHGIPIEACNNFFPADIRLTGEDVDMGITSEYIKRATARAAEMGVKVIVLGSAGAKNIPDGFPHSKAKNQFIELLHHLQGVISVLGITIVLEPLNATESNFILTLNDAVTVMEEAKCDNVKVLVDYYHMRMENESPEIIKRAGSNLRHVHIASKEGRKFPNENDGEDYESFFNALAAVGYDGRVSVEAYSKNIREDAEKSAMLLRRFMS